MLSVLGRRALIATLVHPAKNTRVGFHLLETELAIKRIVIAEALNAAAHGRDAL